MRILLSLAAAGFIAAACSAHAAAPAYGVAFDTLYRIDLDSHTATTIGEAGQFGGQIIGNISGLSSTPDGALYAVAGGFKLLLRIDPSSGAATPVGSLGLAGQGDPARNDALDLNMTAACDGTLYLTSAVAGKIWTVDPASGTPTLLGASGHVITGLVSNGATLYGAGGRDDNNFYRIDPATGAARLIGPFGGAVTRWINSISMSYDAAGTLYAVINYVPPENDNDAPPDWSDLATIDPATGAISVIGPITGPESLRQIGMKGFVIEGAACEAPAGAAGTSVPVTSSWSLALLVVLLAFAGFAGARQSRRA